jgi:hypothetical protein
MSLVVNTSGHLYDDFFYFTHFVKRVLVTFANDKEKKVAFHDDFFYFLSHSSRDKCFGRRMTGGIGSVSISSHYLLSSPEGIC